MKLRGGQKIRLSNPPGKVVLRPELPEKLYLSRRLVNVCYSGFLVAPGEQVEVNTPLASCPECNDMPLLCPVSGVVESIDQDQIVLSNLNSAESGKVRPGVDLLDTLFINGCFRYFSDAFSGKIAKKSCPGAIIVRLTDQDCYVMADDFELIGSLSELAEGLKVMSGLSVELVLYVVVTKKQTKIRNELANLLVGVGNIEFVTIPARYGLDNAMLLANKFGYVEGDNIWSVPPQGVYAVERVVCEGEPANDLWLSLSGPAISSSQYCNVPVGYPLDKLLSDELAADKRYRILSGGVMSGRIIDTSELGLAGNCCGITVLEDSPGRELLKFARFGLDESRFGERYSTLQNGDLRACVSCGYCQGVCPAGLLPDYLHKMIYSDQLDKVQQGGVASCTGCGLCSFVCVSKIDLTREFAKAKSRLVEERVGSEQGSSK